MKIHEVTQGEADWFKLKASIPSSSNFSMLVTGKGEPSTQLDKYALTLAIEKMKGGPIDDEWNGNKYTDRGIELEELARADYAMTRQVKIQQVGFITDALMNYGASTDSLVDDDGVLEIKNLISKTMGELIIYLDRNNNQTPPGYVPQIQGELLVTEREWLDIVFYHPDFKPIIHRHLPDKKFHETLIKQIRRVRIERDRIYEIIMQYQS